MNPVDVDEPPPRRIIALRLLGIMPVCDRCCRHKGSYPSKGGHCGIPAKGDQTVGQKRGRTFLRKSHAQYLRWSARCLRKMRNVAAIQEPERSSFRSYYRGPKPYAWLAAVSHAPSSQACSVCRVRHRTDPGPPRSRPRLRAWSSRAVRSMSLAGSLQAPVDQTRNLASAPLLPRVRWRTLWPTITTEMRTKSCPAKSRKAPITSIPATSPAKVRLSPKTGLNQRTMRM